MHRTPSLTRRTGAVVALSLGMLVVVACGDDDDAVVGGVGESETTTTASEPTSDDALLVTAHDYGFDGLPESVEVGTELALTNISEEEVHEIVLLKVDDSETRPLNELLALPEEERDAIAMFRGVTVAFPGEDAAFTDGSMTLSEPGRYVLLCAIPTGADPQAYRDAVADPDAEGPPDVEGGPPHLVNGMVAEIEVTS